MSTSAAALTVHLETNIQTDIDFINGIRSYLNDMFGIEHATIQVESNSEPGQCYECN